VRGGGQPLPRQLLRQPGHRGLVDGAESESLLDEKGVALADAMREVGLDPARYRESVRDDIDTFLELHIEQGPVLYEEGTDIGVVTSITALCWLSVTVTGRADHAGTTPMDARRDALQAAARMAQEVAAVARDRGRPAVATVGKNSRRNNAGFWCEGHMVVLRPRACGLRSPWGVGTRCYVRIWTSGSVGSCRVRRLRSWVGVGSGRLRRRPGRIQTHRGQGGPGACGAPGAGGSGAGPWRWT